MIYNIQILRGVAALLVVLYHIVLYLDSKEIILNAYKIFLFGDIGVDIFFIVSGFIISRTINNKNKSAIDFLKERLIRVAPPYYFVTLVLSSSLIFFPHFFSELKYSSLHFINSLFFISQIYLQKNPILQVGWSLEYEIFFYLICSLSLFFFRSTHIFLFIILFFSAGAWFGFLNIFFLEFLLGIFLYIIYSRYYPLKFNNFLFLIIIYILCISIFVVVNFDTSKYRILFYGIPSFLVVWSFISLPDLKFNLLKKIGDSSYALYLTHIIIIPAAYKLYIFLNFNLSVGFFLLFSLISCVFFGLFFYKVVEMKLINYFKIL